MWEIIKAKASELPISWFKGAVIFFLGMTTLYYYLSVTQAGVVIRTLRFQVQQQAEALNGQCQTVLENQGFVVTKVPPPAPPPPEEGAEEKEDAKR